MGLEAGFWALGINGFLYPPRYCTMIICGTGDADPISEGHDATRGQRRAAVVTARAVRHAKEPVMATRIKHIPNKLKHDAIVEALLEVRFDMTTVPEVLRGRH